MKARILEVALWSIALGTGASLASSLRALHAPPPDAWRASTESRPGRSARSWPADSIERAAATLVNSDPFRTSHQPSAVEFGTPEAEQAGYPVTPQPRPPLLLQGIVGTTPSWSAIVIGIPGHEGGVLVRQGDTLSGLRVTSVSGKAVVIQGSDTTWHLGLKGPWQ